MGKKDAPRRINLADFKKGKEEEGAVEVVGDSEAVHVLRPPLALTDDEAKVVARAGQDPVAAATAILGGADAYKAFLDDGGSSMIALHLWQEANGDTGE